MSMSCLLGQGWNPGAGMWMPRGKASVAGQSLRSITTVRQALSFVHAALATTKQRVVESSAVEVTQDYLKRLHAAEGQLSSFIAVDDEGALQQVGRVGSANKEPLCHAAAYKQAAGPSAAPAGGGD